MTVAAGNAAFLEKEFTDLKYAGVKTVVPGLAATEPGSDPVEAVRVTYDADKISHETLMRTYWQHADPVNANGSFKESGARFKGAVWVADRRRTRGGGDEPSEAGTQRHLRIGRHLTKNPRERS